jgi:hypothetical protein
MTVPLRDKTGFSVFQGILSVFSTMGIYREVYFDNETSFTNAAKLFVKTIPITVHYSAPYAYAHFQNASETHIKNFKKSFLKLINSPVGPADKTDWSQILPSVTQAVNRQIVAILGMSRESIHFNSPSEHYPLAHIDTEIQDELQDMFNTFDYDFYSTLVMNRLKRQSYLNRARAPEFYEGQLVFIKNLEPSAGSTILKLPYKGPFRVKRMENRNVVLVDLDSGRQTISQVEFLKPLSIKQLRLLISNGIPLSSNLEKRTRTVDDRPLLSPASNPLTQNIVLDPVPKNVDMG